MAEIADSKDEKVAAMAIACEIALKSIESEGGYKAGDKFVEVFLKRYKQILAEVLPPAGVQPKKNVKMTVA